MILFYLSILLSSPINFFVFESPNNKLNRAFGTRGRLMNISLTNWYMLGYWHRRNAGLLPSSPNTFLGLVMVVNCISCCHTNYVFTIKLYSCSSAVFLVSSRFLIIKLCSCRQIVFLVLNLKICSCRQTVFLLSRYVLAITLYSCC